MLDIHALRDLSKNPAINQISLKLLVEFFEYYLEPYRYLFTLEDGTTIQLDFDSHRLCHLLGLESVMKPTPYHILKNYKGQLGYENIKSEAIDFKDLKNKRPKNFSNGKDKFVHFHLIPRLLEESNLLLEYDPGKVQGSRIQCKLLMYSLDESSYVHLGLELEDHGRSYYPRTFFKERITGTSDGLKHIKEQTIVRVIHSQKVSKHQVHTLS
ncbi:MAG: PBECR4 domain-containing protein [Tumebacillaceae bacterium]